MLVCVAGVVLRGVGLDYVTGCGLGASSFSIIINTMNSPIMIIIIDGLEGVHPPLETSPGPPTATCAHANTRTHRASGGMQATVAVLAVCRLNVEVLADTEGQRFYLCAYVYMYSYRYVEGTGFSDVVCGIIGSPCSMNMVS